jgi:hypothetical protein
MPLPQMSACFSGWKQDIVYTKILSQSVDNDGFSVNNTFSDIAQAVVQPLTATELRMKPDGERSWNWQMVHIEGNTQLLNTGDFIIYNDIKYRITAVFPYFAYNYCQYHAVQHQNNI